MSRKTPAELLAALNKYAADETITGKGPLSVVLILTRAASKRKPPYSEREFITPRGGQVAGLSGQAIAGILRDHGIHRTLSEEGGRTSRGSIERMRRYVSLLNHLHAEGLLNFPIIEDFWVQRVRAFFASMPLRLKLDTAKSLRTLVMELLAAALARQREQVGTMVVGAVMQHLVGAKLEILLPPGSVLHQGFSVADSPTGRTGDFCISDTVIHVTTAPSEALLRKCKQNLSEGRRPVIVTTDRGVSGAIALAEAAGPDLSERLEVLDIQQFIATNVYEWSHFRGEKRSSSIRELILAYNKIVEAHETDLSLRIELG